MRHGAQIDPEILKRLTKILARTASDYDGEALAAARKAAAILSKHNLSYEDVLAPKRQMSSPALAREVGRLRQCLKAERRRADLLEAALKDAEAQADGSAAPFFHTLEQLRKYLMGNVVLKRHERQLLENIEDPKPKTKEAHIVLICAQRYGVAFG